MQLPTKGQVYHLTAPAAYLTTMKAGEYEVVEIRGSYDYCVVKQNRIGAKNSWSISFKEWNLFTPTLTTSVGKSQQKAKTLRNTKVEKVAGAIGMSRRYYNSNRAVLQPCQVVSVLPDGRMVIKWLIDSVQCETSYPLSAYDSKWLPKYYAELERQLNELEEKKNYVWWVMTEVADSLKA